jgi:hypothetical protein
MAAVGLGCVYVTGLLVGAGDELGLAFAFPAPRTVSARSGWLVVAAAWDEFALVRLIGANPLCSSGPGFRQ